MGAIEPSVCSDKTSTVTRLVKQQNATAKDGEVLSSLNFGTDAAGEIIPNSRAAGSSWTWLPCSSSLPSVASTPPGPAPASLLSSLVPGFQQPTMTISNWEARTKFVQADYYGERVSSCYGLAPAPQQQPRALLDDFLLRNDDLSLSCSHPSSSFSQQQHQFVEGSSYPAGAASPTPPAVGNLELLLGSSSVDCKPSNSSTWFSWRQEENFTGGFGIDDNSFTSRVGGQFLWPVYNAVADNSKQQQSHQHQGVPTKRASSSPQEHTEAKRLKSSPKQQRSTKRSNAHKKEPALNTNLKPRAKQGCANDPQSIAARQRRERISDRLKILQELIPDGSKVDLVTMLEKAINYVKFLQLKVKVLMNDEYWPKQSQDEEVEENEQREGS